MSDHEGPGLFEQSEQSQRSCCIVPAALQFGNAIPLLGNSPLRIGQAPGRLLQMLQLAWHQEILSNICVNANVQSRALLAPTAPSGS